jgi:hypothetical protein
MTHHLLETAARIAKTKRHPTELKEVKEGDDGCLLSVLWPHWYLPVAFSEVNLGEHLAATEPGGEVQHVEKRIHISLCC